MSGAAAKKNRVSWLYAFLVFLAAIIFHIFMPVKYHHRERTMLDAPYIVIGNHLAALDPVIVAYGCRRYQIRFLGKAELTKNPILRYLFGRIQIIPVNRFQTDMKAMRATLKVLKDGNVLGIFPEGTRFKEGVMENMEGGVAMIALQSDVPILPAYIPTKLKWFRTTHCYFGETFTVSDLKAKGINKESAAAVLARIQEVYQNLMAESAQTPQ